jgi:hypothetical protein
MSSRTKTKPEPHEQGYIGWRGELIAKLALTRAGLVVPDAPTPEPFDLLASTHDGFYFLVEVKAYSSMHGNHGPAFGESRQQQQWPVDSSTLRATEEVNVPVVLFIIDADREIGHYARLDRLPRPARNQRTTSVPLVADHDLTPTALVRLVAELRQDRSASRRPA